MPGGITANSVKALAFSLGADLVGIAPVERFEEAPIMISPKGHLPSAKSVIVVAVHHPDASIELGGEPSPHDVGPYNIQGAMNTKLDFISFRIARYLEEGGYDALPIPVTNVWRYRPYKDISTSFTADLSQRHAAVAAGLGELGWSGLLLTPEFGPRQRITSVITSAPLEPDPMYQGPPLCDRCGRCIEGCHECADALSKEVSVNVVKIGERVFEYAGINKWRCSWSEHFGLDVDLPIPEVVTEEVILSARAEHGVRGGVMGYCLRFCMPPHLRVEDPGYTRVWRRKRPFVQGEGASMRDLTERVKALSVEKGADLVGIASEEMLDKHGIPPKRYLPDGKSAIVVGMEYPSGYDENPSGLGYIKGVINTKLSFISLDISSYLERHGYSALPMSGMPDDRAAAVAGLAEGGEDRRLFTTIVTSAPLFATERKGVLPSRRRVPLTSERVKEIARELGADLVGIASTDRFEEIRGLKRPQEILTGCRSVIVIGVHYPDASIERATEPPAEAVGPYAYTQYETTWQLDYLALELMRYLDSHGHSCFTARNLFGDSTTVITPRGEMPDAAADRFAAVAAGLGEMGWNGVVLTPEYGPRQRFISILTDASLEPDPLYQGPPLCDRCLLCAKACPVGALSEEEKVTVQIGDRTFEYGRLERSRCDWAKRYGLVAEEGPKYMGSETNIGPPEDITEEAIAAAMERRDAVQGHWTCILEHCIRVCMPPHLRMEDRGFCGVYRRKRP